MCDDPCCGDEGADGVVVPQVAVQLTYVGVVQDGWVQCSVWVWVVSVWKVFEFWIEVCVRVCS